MPQTKFKLGWFYNINHGYDRLKEPYRFLLMLALVVPGIFCISMPSENPWYAIGGFIYLFAVTGFRAVYVHKYLNRAG